MSELVSSARIAEITGFTVRWVQEHAGKGDIPGAVKLCGGWRFDEAMVRGWIRSSNPREKTWHPSIKEAKRGGAGSHIRDTKAALHLKQLLGMSPTSGSPNGSRKQKRPTGETAQGKHTTTP